MIERINLNKTTYYYENHLLILTALKRKVWSIQSLNNVGHLNLYFF